MKLEFVRGDITQENTEAIVNAANSRLAGGGGVDGAIHRKGGPKIMQELQEKYKGCPTGEAVITGGGNLEAKYVIHAVGPFYSGTPKDAELLSSAYLKSLELASQKGIKRISFPSISTGAYRYPLGEAAHIAVSTVLNYGKAHPEIELVRFVLFDEETLSTYHQVYTHLEEKERIKSAISGKLKK